MAPALRTIERQIERENSMMAARFGQICRILDQKIGEGEVAR